MIEFFKYQGTGNDFIIIDNRNNQVQLSAQQIERMCNRRFGIGADGLILLQRHKNLDFCMTYYNSDGNESSMCGNGGRCIAAFAHSLQLGSNNKLVFEAIDGVHEALINENGIVTLKMNDVCRVDWIQNNVAELNTGSPHYVAFTDDIAHLNLIEWARNIRYSEAYKEKGINVNAVEVVDTDSLKVRTYERGVENETLSCGTGVTACAIAYALKHKTDAKQNHILVDTPGGKLEVTFELNNECITNIWLKGNAVFVFKGYINL